LLYIVVTHLSERNLEILEKKELREILKFYKNIYIGSTLDINDKSLFSTWYEFLKDYSFEQVRNAIIKRSTQSTFPANILEIISNIEVPDYTIELIEPYTVIVSFEDEEYGNFPFRFFNSQEAKKNIEKFKECSYDKESIRILHEQHVRERNSGVLTYRGEAKARLEQKLQNQNNKGSRRYDKQSNFSW
jgi:hypothetical protein